VLGLWLNLILITLVPALRADDEDDSFGNVNSTRQTSVIDFGGPKNVVRQNQSQTSQTFNQNRSFQNQSQSSVQQNRWDQDLKASTTWFEREEKRNQEESRWIQAEQEARNEEADAEQWRNVETVAGAFVATGPYYKSGNKMVQTDKGLVYAVGRDGVVAPDGYYFRNGDFWVGPNNKGGTVSGSGNNEFIAGGSQGSAIGSGRGFFTERGYSWPAYPDQTYRGVSSTMRRP